MGIASDAAAAYGPGNIDKSAIVAVFGDIETSIDANGTAIATINNQLILATETTLGLVEKATAQEIVDGTADKYPDAAGLRVALNAVLVPAFGAVGDTAELRSIAINVGWDAGDEVDGGDFIYAGSRNNNGNTDPVVNAGNLGASPAGIWRACSHVNLVGGVYYSKGLFKRIQ